MYIYIYNILFRDYIYIEREREHICWRCDTFKLATYTLSFFQERATYTTNPDVHVGHGMPRQV